MSKRTVKILSLVLAILLLFSALPLAASVAETDAAETGDPGGTFGEPSAVTVIAKGSGLSYRWYYWKEEKQKWIPSQDFDNIYDIVMKESLSQRRIKCKITDAAGNSVESNVVSLLIPKG